MAWLIPRFKELERIHWARENIRTFKCRSVFGITFADTLKYYTSQIFGVSNLNVLINTTYYTGGYTENEMNGSVL